MSNIRYNFKRVEREAEEIESVEPCSTFQLSLLLLGVLVTRSLGPVTVTIPEVKDSVNLGMESCQARLTCEIPESKVAQQRCLALRSRDLDRFKG